LNKTGQGIIIGFIGCLGLLSVVIFLAPTIIEMQRIAEYEASVKEWRDAGYDLIVDKYGTTCPTKQYQMWDNSCNFAIPLEKIPSQSPSESTLMWLEENKSFNEELKQNPNFANCDLARRNIVAIQETVDILPKEDANAKIYMDGIHMYEESIQKYCQNE
jgi:hypothetical protein